MTDTDSLETKLCLKFCAYYKHGKNEELACRGFTVVEQLLQGGKDLVFEKFEREFDASSQEELRQRMCLACEFHEQDCDYMLDRTAPPCGGFVLIAQLLGSGALLIEEIE